MSSPKSHTHSTHTTSIQTQASDALALIKEVTGKLPIDDALPPKDLQAAKVTNRVPLEVMTIASSVLNEDPTQFPQFDGAGIRSAVEYEQAMAPVAVALQVLAERVQKSVLKRRAGAANQSLALYAVMKGTARLPANEQTRTQVRTMGQLLTTNRKSRATSVTEKEKEQFAKGLKVSKKAAAAKATVDDASAKAAYADAEANLVNGNLGALTPTSDPPAPTVAPSSPSPTAPPSTNGVAAH